jgi:hypothetical protein
MARIGEPVRRPHGRPQIRSDEDTRRLMTEAAAGEFQANGYAGTGIGAVALVAGVSTKAHLFGLVATDRIGRFRLTFGDGAFDPQEPGLPSGYSQRSHSGSSLGMYSWVYPAEPPMKTSVGW